MTDAQVKKSVRAALLGRGWLLDQENPGKLISTLNLRKHTAKIAIDYDTKQVRSKHLESTNLLEEDKNGQRVIHRSYVTWTNSLVLDITRNLQLTAS